MKKQLGSPGNRKMYNTDTAKAVFNRSGGRGEGRFYETLYKTKRGDYFIHGKGGVLTRWNGGEDLIEIEGKALKHWLSCPETEAG